MEPARGERERREREREERSGLRVFRFQCEAPTICFTLLKTLRAFFSERASSLRLCVASPSRERSGSRLRALSTRTSARRAPEKRAPSEGKKSRARARDLTTTAATNDGPLPIDPAIRPTPFFAPSPVATTIALFLGNDHTGPRSEKQLTRGIQDEVHPLAGVQRRARMEGR